MLALAILLCGIFSRLLPHGSNFTPVIALALFSGVYCPRKYAVVAPLLLMMISDLFLGWHSTIPFTWGSIVLISYLGLRLREHRQPLWIMGGGIVSAILFFVITNFGSWFALYPLTPAGLRECYIAAIPFFRNTFVSTMVFGAIIFGFYEVVARRVKTTRFGHVL